MRISKYARIILLNTLFWMMIISSHLFPEENQLYRLFQNRTDHFDWRRGVFSASAILGTVAGIYISTRPIYYDEPTVPFHFSRSPDGSLKLFENRVRGLDKFGHVYSSSLFYQNIYFLSRWSGCTHKTAMFSSASLTFAIMTGMEIHDGYYKRWGFTVGDFISNLTGIILPVGQQNIPALQYIDYKFSFNFTAKRYGEAEIEDYGNMTFWLTANPAGLLQPERVSDSPALLRGLNIALGVGITSPRYPPQREIYISLDYNLKQLIHSHSDFLNHLIALLDRFHLPAPAIRITPNYIGYGLFF